MTTRAALRRRWVGPEGASALAGAWEWLAGGPRPDALEDHEGRADLRGLPLPNPQVSKGYRLGSMTVSHLSGMAEFRGIHWQAVDFTHSDMAHARFTASRVDDCVFDGAACTDWRLWSVQISGCSFRRTALRGSALGTWHAGEGNAWADVVFDSADLRDSFFHGGTLHRCSFVNSKLKGVEFSQVALADARFAGEVRDVLFDGRNLPERPPPRALRNVDFSAAVLADVDFRGCTFDGVKLPLGSQRVWGFPVVARRALALLADDDSLESRVLKAQFENELKWPGADDSDWVLTHADYIASGGEPLLDLLLSTLKRAGASL